MPASPHHPSFEDLFGAPPQVRVSAPGRVNVIGEHTDYNGGFVLPAAIPQRTWVEAARGAGAMVDVWSREAPAGRRRVEYELGTETPRRAWTDYVAGVTHVLAREGHPIGGVQLRIESTVPLGSGVSSSAALLVAVLQALRDCFRLALDDVGLAMLAHRVETDFVGAPVGTMDQMACALADESHVLFLDTRSGAYERVALPAGTALVVIDSGVTHSHAGGDYRVRRAECDRAAALLGVPQLRDITAGDPRLAALPAPLDRRARHVVTENARVLETVEAFRADDAAAAGRLLSASHCSMRDDFDVSVPEVDLLVTLAEGQPGVFGARLTGGGFGGAIVALTENGAAVRVAADTARAYSERSGCTGRVLVPVPAADLG